ncbi:MAG: hypothetical protein FJ279_32550, partial [Planctomycetes bacterium]|nr:hypothetical protein [Planctomycetota bacterium]
MTTAVLFGLLIAVSACAQMAGPNGEAAQWPQNARSLAQQLEQALRDYEAKTGREKAWANGDFALAKLKLEKARLLVHRYTPSDLRDQLVMRDLELGKRIVEALAVGKLPLRPDTGIIEKAYIADNDGSAQPYVVYVPQTLKRGEKVPLFVFLHGYASYLDKVNWVELMFSEELGNLCEELPMIAMLPFGRSNTEFMGVGEVDVLKAIELTKKFFPIDDGRVFISGGSMGGSGAYTITCHYPHLFAGLAPINGRADYYLWQRLDKDKLPPFKRIQTDLDYAAAFPHNLLNVPTFIFHGEMDSLVDVAQSRRF